MKAAVFSDLHLDYSREPDFSIEVAEDVDVIVIAGDVTAPVADSARWAHRMYGSRGKRVVMVPGNHEHCRKVGTFETSLFLTFDHKDNRDDDIPTGSFT